MGLFGKSCQRTDEGILEALIEGYDLKKAMEATSFHGFRSQAVKRMACGVKGFRKITDKKNPEEIPARKYAMKEYLLESAVGSVVFAYRLAVKEGNEEVIEDVKKCLFSPYVLKCCEQWHKQSQHHLVLQYFCLVNAIGVPSAGYPQNAEKASMLLQKVKTVVDKEFDEYDLSVFINEVNRATGDNKEKCSLNTDEMSTPAKTETKRTEFNNGDVYEGEYLNGKKHGKGKYSFANGGVYEGNYVNNYICGYGKMTFSSGDIYEGEWKDSKKHGRGKYTSMQGWVYEGDFVNSNFEGKGKQTFANGDVYEGEWKNDKKHGKGKYTSVKGGSYDGDWANDVFHGHGRYVFNDGIVHEGEFIDGKMTGKGKRIYKDGTYYDGDWVDGKKHGHGVYTEKLGEYLQQYEGEFVDGKPDGRHVGFTVGSTSGSKDLHFYENGESVGCVTLTEETKSWTVHDFRESRKRSNAEIGLDEHGYPLPVSSSAPTASVAPVSDDADSENYYAAAQAAWDRDDYFRCCYYMRCAGKMYGEHQFRYQTAHYYCRGDKEGKAYQIVKDLMCNKNLSDVSYADAIFCLYLFKEFIPHETDLEAMANCYYRIGDIKSAARWMPMSRLFFIRNGEVYSTEDLLAGKGGNAFPLADEIMAFRLLQKALGLWKRGKCSKDLKYFAEQVDDSAKIINKYIQCAKNGSQQYRLSEIVEQTNLLRSEIKDYLW